MTTVLQAIGNSRGSPVPLGELEDVDSDFLLQDGFSRVIRSDRDIVEMAVQAVSDSLSRTDIQASDVDAVVICTESFWDVDVRMLRELTLPEYDRLHEGFLRGILGTGVVDAQPYGNWLSGCGNFVATLGMAKSLVESGRHRNVLAVIADRHPPQTSRMMKNGSSVYSDVACAFVVGSGRSGFEIVSIVSHTDLPLLKAHDSGNSIAESQGLKAALGHFARKIKTVTGRPLRDYPFVVADNFHRFFLEFMSDPLEIEADRLLLPTKATIAHAYSVDGLMSAAHLFNTGQLKRGETLALLNIGMCTFGLAVLEAI
jgi:3-oxoacyl-[acyl-carrier-protein] synthase III